METPRPTPQLRESKKRSDPAQPSLLIRLHFRPQLTELAKLVAYDDVPVDQIKPQLDTLTEQYGRDLIEAAMVELLDSRTETRTVVSLKAEVRRLCRQFLGPPPSEPASRRSEVVEPTLVIPAPSPAIVPATPDDEERYQAAYEAHEGLLYCCDRPNLKWAGDIGDLSVVCESCGYVLFARDELMPEGEPPGILLGPQSTVSES